MNNRISPSLILTMICLSVLCCSPLAYADGSSSNNHLGLFIGILIVCASGIIMSLTNRHFKKKRETKQKKNSARKRPATSGKNSNKKRNAKKSAQSRAKNRR